MWRSEVPIHMPSTSSTDTDRKRGAEFPGDRTGDERLAAAGRPVQQETAAQAPAVQLAQFGVAQRGEEGGLEAVLDVLHAADVGQTDPSGLLHVPRVGVPGSVLPVPTNRGGFTSRVRPTAACRSNPGR
ncbi:hypothetical protein GCM10010273_65740 [Streptomyces lavendulocolor]